MSNRESNNEVKGVFEKFKIQCKEAKESHESLIVLLPDEERDRHETCFKAKMLWVEDFISVVNNWLEKLQEEFVLPAKLNPMIVFQISKQGSAVALQVAKVAVTVHAPVNLVHRCNLHVLRLKRKRQLWSLNQNL